jgi:hypothetical protein
MGFQIRDRKERSLVAAGLDANRLTGMPADATPLDVRLGSRGFALQTVWPQEELERLRARLALRPEAYG